MLWLTAIANVALWWFISDQLLVFMHRERYGRFRSRWRLALDLVRRPLSAPSIIRSDTVEQYRARFDVADDPPVERQRRRSMAAFAIYIGSLFIGLPVTFVLVAIIRHVLPGTVALWVITAGGCLVSSVGLVFYAESAICGIVDQSGQHAILIINGGGVFIGASVSVTPAVLVSNGTSVADQSGAFSDVGVAAGYAYLGFGASTATGTNSSGQTINTTMFLLGPGVGTPSVSFGQSNTTVITDPDLVKLYESQFGGLDPFLAGASVLSGN